MFKRDRNVSESRVYAGDTIINVFDARQIHSEIYSQKNAYCQNMQKIRIDCKYSASQIKPRHRKSAVAMSIRIIQIKRILLTNFSKNHIIFPEGGFICRRGREIKPIPDYSYREEQEKQRQATIELMLAGLPAFCRDFLYYKERYKERRTNRLTLVAYLQHIRTFLEYLSVNDIRFAGQLSH